ncbi:MAG TPA: flagellar protein FlbB [Leptospiraceae bacterium]|nr:flagellar protein FlbB [Leptospiraceae bacterium]HNF12682.1 flagellar protein FlbB [Leptospiraceae bacterium]HNF23229.1 flagellar protein FlbB [Leptospiraceae bacterium]HNI94829.1 flagellar protein FlbB [Leptospiraceae bacterium]HNM01378.1 flagellar protein FlbB [Leptospiraceae bacterium]
MGTMNDRVRAFYLILLIIFLLAIGFFVFDYYKLIDADEIFPFLAKKPAAVSWDQESPTEVEKLEIEKAKERISEESSEIEKLRNELQAEREKLDAEKVKLEEAKQGIKEKERQMQMKEKEDANRLSKLRALAGKISNMPPKSAVELLVNWPDQDIIDVFKQMDRDAEEEGKASITNYLLTLFDPKRRSVITNKWLDSESDKVPEENINTLLEQEVVP